MDSVLQDFRYAIRTLLKKPTVSAIAVLTLALGIGGTVAVFTIVDTLLLRELPYRDPDRIITIWQTNIERPDEREGASPGAFLDWRERSTAFTALAAAEPMSFDYLGGHEPETLIGALVTEGFFDALGVEMLLGRAFRPEEHTAGRADVVLISYGAWQRRFAGDRAIVGRQIELEGRPHVIVGVVPRWFEPRLPERPREHEIWAPKVVQQSERTARRTRYWAVVGRLSPGVNLQRADAELSSISTDLAREFPQTMGSTTATIEPLRDHLVGSVREPLILVFGAVTLVLLIACANVANLLLARGVERQREFTIRVAIGAGRWRIVRQMLVESLTLATIACAAGLVLAQWTLGVFVALNPGGIPQFDEASLGLNARILLFTIALSVSTAIFFGLWPAIRLSRSAAQDAISETHTRSTTSVRRRALPVLVAAEVAIAFVLLVGAGLLVRSFVSLLRVDPGFVKANVAVAQVFVYGPRYTDNARRVAFFGQSLERIRALPGVVAAGIVSAMPFIGANIAIEGGFRVEGRPEPPQDQQPSSHLTVATADYFHAMRVPLRRGRVFSDIDRADMTPVAIINELIAERHFPAENPVGQRISVNWLGRWRTMEVVGVVGPTRHEALDSGARPEVFMPFAQAPFGSMTFVVRSSVDPATLLPAVKAQIWAVDPTLPIYDTATVDGLVSQSLSSRRFMTRLLGALALLAFILAAAGIYGILSFSTAQRTREIGVRIAIGAHARDIARLVVGEGMRVVFLGVLVGLAGALAVSRLLTASLYEVSPTDPLTLASTTLMLVSVALMACYLPARRAARVDPLVALRYE